LPGSIAATGSADVVFSWLCSPEAVESLDVAYTETSAESVAISGYSIGIQTHKKGILNYRMSWTYVDPAAPTPACDAGFVVDSDVSVDVGVTSFSVSAN
jgi:hypothetical protein